MFIHYSEHVIDLLDVHVHVGHVKNLLCSRYIKHETSRKSYRVIRLSWHQQLWWSYWHCSSSCFFQEDTKMRRHLTLLDTDALASHFWYRMFELPTFMETVAWLGSRLLLLKIVESLQQRKGVRKSIFYCWLQNSSFVLMLKIQLNFHSFDEMAFEISTSF